jgi:hypothetical protein
VVSPWATLNTRSTCRSVEGTNKKGQTQVTLRGASGQPVVIDTLSADQGSTYGFDTKQKAHL